MFNTLIHVEHERGAFYQPLLIIDWLNRFSSGNDAS